MKRRQESKTQRDNLTTVLVSGSRRYLEQDCGRMCLFDVRLQQSRRAEEGGAIMPRFESPERITQHQLGEGFPPEPNILH